MNSCTFFNRKDAKDPQSNQGMTTNDIFQAQAQANPMLFALCSLLN